jgi:small subunit ribosomal protein S1
MAVSTGEKPTSINDLQPKMELTGVVKKVELFGAFVDVGVGQDGLLHISQLSSGHVRNVTDVVNEGDEINVWVMAVDAKKGRYNLTMVRPPDRTWDEVNTGDVVEGKVVRVEKFGAFVDIGAESNGRIHVSELSTEYVKEPSDVINVGDEVKVKIIAVNPRKRQIDLSIKALQEPAAAANAYIEDEEEERMPTAMELALRQAMEGTSMEDELPQRKSGRKRGKKRKTQRAKQEDILARTLETRKN